MKTIVRMKFGSHLYGLSTPESDTDYKSIYLPELNELLLGTAKKSISSSTGNSKSRNTKDDIDDDYISLNEFIRLACNGETMALDMLHANDVENCGAIWRDLVSKREMFYTTNLNAYMGYVKTQAAKYGIKGSRLAGMREAIDFLKKYVDKGLLLSDVWDDLPLNDYARKITLPKKKGDGVDHFYEVNTKKYQMNNKVDYACERLELMFASYGARALKAERNEGVDHKAVSHAIRAGCQMRDIFSKGSFKYPLDETDFILKVKRGELHYLHDVAPYLEDLVDEIDGLVLENKFNFPEHTDREFWNKWLIDVYTKYLIDPIYIS